MRNKVVKNVDDHLEGLIRHPRWYMVRHVLLSGIFSAAGGAVIGLVLPWIYEAFPKDSGKLLTALILLIAVAALRVAGSWFVVIYYAPWVQRLTKRAVNQHHNPPSRDVPAVREAFGESVTLKVIALCSAFAYILVDMGNPSETHTGALTAWILTTSWSNPLIVALAGGFFGISQSLCKEPVIKGIWHNKTFVDTSDY